VNRRRIAIACQGGGSQCAFVAGALKGLFSQGIQYRYKIVGLSGTSGGAITAALAWHGLLEQARGSRTPVEDGIMALWRDLTAQTPQEILFDAFCLQTMRLTERGLLPSYPVSPSSARFRAFQQTTARLLPRAEFTDFRALLLKHINFEALPSMVDGDSPVLLVGAGDVLEGGFKIFSSARGEIKIESLLASAAIPNLFPAVWADDHAYWDGIFASNPPVTGFLRKVLMGAESPPEEIWVIQVNPTKIDAVPETPSDISGRRNQLAGNLSLQHELQVIAMVNFLLQEGALTDGFRARFGLDTTQSITVRFIRMSEDLLKGLDYPSKLSRQPRQMAQLIADGEAQALSFLSQLPDSEALWNARSPEGVRPEKTS
jgi:NTE family protein